VGLGVNIDCIAPSVEAADAIVREMVISGPETHVKWSLIDGLQPGYFYPETDIAAVDEKIAIRKLNLPYFTVGRDGCADRSNRLPVHEGLQHVIAHLKKRNCTDIRYSFSRVVLSCESLAGDSSAGTTVQVSPLSARQRWCIPQTGADNAGPY
jgi:hypothetical protein